MKTFGITAAILSVALAACSNGSSDSPVEKTNDTNQPPAVGVPVTPTSAPTPLETAPALQETAATQATKTQ